MLKLCLSVIVVLFTFSSAINFTWKGTDGSSFTTTTNWQPAEACSANCYPGGTNPPRNPRDVATISTTNATINSDIKSAPIVNVQNTGGLKLARNDVAIDAYSQTAGNLQVLNRATAKSVTASGGTIAIAANFEVTDSFTISNTVTLNIDAGANRNIKASSFTFSPLTINCPSGTNQVTFTGPVTAKQLTLVGSCYFFFDNFATIGQNFIVSSGTRARLTNANNKVVVSDQATLSVQGSLVDMPTLEIAQEAKLTVDSNGKINEGTTINISQTSQLSQVEILSQNPINIVQGQAQGNLLINNAQASVKFSGTTAITTARVWNFAQCTGVEVTPSLTIGSNSELKVSCPTTLNGAVTLNGGTLNLNNGATARVTAGLTATQIGSRIIGSGTLKLTGGTSLFSGSGISLPSTFTLLLEGGNLNIDANYDWQGPTIKVVSATSTLKFGTDSFTLRSNSGSGSLLWQSGSIVSPTNGMTFDGSLLTVQNSNNPTFNSKLFFKNSGTFSVKNTLTLGQGVATFTASSIASLEAAVTLSSNYQLLMTDSSLTSSVGLNLGGTNIIKNSAGSFSNSPLQVSSGTLTLTAQSNWAGISSLQLNGAVSIEGSAISCTTATIGNAGSLTVKETNSIFTGAISSSTGSISVLSSGKITTSSFTSSAGTITVNNGIFSIGDGAVDTASITISGGGSLKVTGSQNFGATTQVPITLNTGSLTVDSSATLKITRMKTTASSTSNIFVNGNLIWQPTNGCSNLDLKDSFQMSGTGSLQITATTCNINVYSVINLNGGALTVASNGGLQAMNSGQIKVTSGSVTFQKSVVFRDSTQYDFSNSAVVHNGINLEDSAKLLFTQKSTTIGGSINWEDDSALEVRSTGTILTIKSGANLEWEDTSTLLVDDAARLVLGDGNTIRFRNNFIGNITNGGRLVVNTRNDYINVEDRGILHLTRSIIEVTRGPDCVLLCNQECGIRFAANTKIILNDLSTAVGVKRTVKDCNIYMTKGSNIYADQSSYQQLNLESNPWRLPNNKNDADAILIITGDTNFSGSDNTFEPQYGPCATYDGNNVTISNNSTGRIHGTACVVVGPTNSLVVSDSTLRIEDSGRLKIVGESSFILQGSSTFIVQNKGLLNIVEKSFCKWGADVSFSTEALNEEVTEVVQGEPPLNEQVNFYIDDSSFEIEKTATFGSNTRARVANQSFFTVTGNLNVIGESVFEVFNSTVQGNSVMNVESTFVSNDGSSITFNSDLKISNSGEVLIEKSVVTVSTDGNIQISQESELTIASASEVTVIGDVTLVSKGKIIATDEDSKMTLRDGAVITVKDALFEVTNFAKLSVGNVQVLLIGDSVQNSPGILKVTSKGFLDLTDGQSSIKMVKGLFAADNGTVTLGNGKVLVNDSSIEITNKSTFTMNSGEISGIKDGFIQVDNSEFTLASGKVSLISNAELSIENKGDFFLKGSLTISDSSILDINDSNLDINGEFLLTDSATANLEQGASINVIDGNVQIVKDALALITNDSMLSVKGSASLYIDNQAKLQANQGGTIEITAKTIECSGTSTLSVLTDGKVLINGGALNLNQDSLLEVANGQITISANNLNLLANSRLLLLGTSGSVTLEGGDAYLKGNSESHLKLLGKLDINNGKIECSEYAKLTIATEASLNINNISGSATFFEECTTEIISNGKFSSRGPTTFAGSSKLTLNNNGLFEVQDGQTLFTDTTTIYVSSGSFSCTGGNAKFLENAELTISGTNSLFQVNGDVLFSDTSKLIMNDNSQMVVQGNLAQNLNSEFNINEGSLLTVSGEDATFASFNDSSIRVQSSGKLLITDSGDVQLFDDSKYTLSSGFLFIVGGKGTMLLYDSASIITEESSELDMNGYLELNMWSAMNFSKSLGIVSGGNVLVQDFAMISLTDNSIMQVNDGNVIFIESSVLYIDNTSSFIVNGGNVYFSNNSNVITEPGASLTVRDGNLVIEDQFCTTMDSVTIQVGGEMELTGNTCLNLLNSFVEIESDSGKLSTRDNSLLTLDSTTFTITKGDAIFYGTSSHSFKNVAFTVQDGNAEFGETVSPKFTSTNFTVNGNALFSSNAISFWESSSLILANNVVWRDSASPTFSNSKISVTQGSVVVLDSASLSLLKTSLSITTAGEFIVAGTATHSLITSPVFVSGSAIFKDTIDINFQNSNIEIQGSARFLDQTTVSFNSLSFTVVGGDVITREDAFLVLENSALVIDAGSLFLYDSSLIFFEDSTLSIQVGGNGIQAYNSSYAQFTRSPITVYGALSLHNNATMKLVDVGSNVRLFGLFELLDTSVFLSPPQISIEVFDGSFNVEDFVDLYLEANLFVQGSVNLRDSSTLTLQNTNLNIDSGSFNTFDDHKLTVQNSVFSINSESLVSFAVNFQGTTNSEHFFRSTSFNVITGRVSFTEETRPTFIESFISINGEVSWNQNSKTQLENTPFIIENGSFLVENSATGDFFNSPLTLIANGGEFRAFSQAYLTFTRSSIQMDGGSVVFTGFSTLEFTDIETTLLINNGNFDFLENSRFITVQGTRIRVVGGDFRLFDSVDIAFDQVQLFVSGNVALFDTSALSMVDSQLQINGGTFSTFDEITFSTSTSTIEIAGNMILSGTDQSTQEFIDSTVSIIGGSLITTNNGIPRFEGSQITLTSGELSLEESSKPTFVSSSINIVGGSFLASDTTEAYFISTPLTIEAGVDGLLSATDFSKLFFESSPILMDGGNVRFAGDSELHFTNAETTLTINDGNFEIADRAKFFTVVGTQIFINGGNFVLNDDVELYFLGVSIRIAGNFILNNLSKILFEQSTIDIIGSYILNDQATLELVSSTVNINGGTLSTRNSVSFSANFSTINVNGSVELFGDESSSHNFNNSFLNIAEGNFEIYEKVNAEFFDSTVSITGGFLENYDESSLILSSSTLTLRGVGTVLVNDDASFILRDNSLAEVITEGAVATFSNSALVETYDSSIFRVTDGSVTFQDNSVFNLNVGTEINIIGGSFVLKDSSNMTAYPFTTGTILGGNFYVMDDAVLKFIGSNIVIVGAVNNNSSVAIEFGSGTNFTVNGGNVTENGSGVIRLNENSFLLISGGNLILEDMSQIIANSATVLITGGSLIATDFSKITATNESLVVVQGGDITTMDNAIFNITDRSTVLVTATTDTTGSVFVRDRSYIVVSESSQLRVEDGNIVISNNGRIRNEINSLISVRGDFQILDYATFEGLPTSTLEVLDGGNFIASGAGVRILLDQSLTQVRGGDFVSSIRTVLSASNSDIQISESGSVYLTDLTRTLLSEETNLSIFGGGNLELDRNAYLSANTLSIISINDGGSVLFNEYSIFEIAGSSSLLVGNRGSVDFFNSATIKASDFSEVVVSGGGGISFNQQSKAVLSTGASLKVFDSGSIIFSTDSSASLASGSTLLVEDGGNIEFNDRSTLFSSNSILSVLGGGNIQFTGDGINNVRERSQFIVDGGDVIYRGRKIINFFNSFLQVKSGNILAYDETTFNLLETSSASIEGGNFILRNSSIINFKQSSSMTISSGNVELYDDGIVDLEDSSITVTGSNSATGFFMISQSVFVSLKDSLITVNGGDFISNDNIAIQSLQSALTVNSGSAIFNANTKYNGMGSTVSVTGGNLQIRDRTEWIMTDQSIASVSGGDLILEGQSINSLLDSQFIVEQGNCKLLTQASLVMKDSGLTVTGGDLLFSDSALYNGVTSSIFVSGGRIIYDLRTRFIVVTCNITVHKDGTQFARLPSPIEDNDLIIVGGDAIFSASAQSVINVIRGNFVFVERSVSSIIDSTVNTAGGNMKFTGQSVVDVLTSSVIISEGSFEVYQNSRLNVHAQSLVDITGGNLIVSGATLFDLADSQIQITAGSARFNGGTINSRTSSLLVDGDGSIEFFGNALVNVLSSEFGLSGNGQFNVGAQTIFGFSQSSLTILGGTFRSTNDASLTFTSSDFSIQGGNTYFADQSRVNVLQSNFYVLGGNVYFTDRSSVFIREDSTYLVEGGNVFTQGSASLNIEKSCFTVKEGNVQYQGSSEITLQESCWIISGGNVALIDSIVYKLLRSSFLRIEEGSLTATGAINFFIDASQIFVSGGDLTAEGSTLLRISEGSFVDVSRGSAIFAGSTVASITDSTFSVSGGFVEFSGSADLSWQISTLSISAGNMITSGTSTVRFVDSSIAVSGGGLRFEGASQVEIISSIVSVNIGSINFIEDTVVNFIDSNVNVAKGDIQFGGNSEVIFNRAPVLLSGQLEFLDNAQIKFINSDVTIIGGNLHAKDHSNIRYESCNLQIGGNLFVQNFADVSIQRSDININNGDLQIIDQGTFALHNSQMRIQNGNFIANNPSNTRKYISLVDSNISVEKGVSTLDGSVKLNGNVEISLLGTEMFVNGNLQMSGAAKLNIFQQSIFSIPNGVVIMEDSSEVVVEANSALLNRGQLFAPGFIKVPSDSSFENEGILETDHDFNSNCFTDLAERATLMNSGSFTLRNRDTSTVLQSCIDDIAHSGLMQMSGSNVTFNQIRTSVGSTLTLQSSSIQISNGSPFSSEGSVGGSGTFVGSFINNPNAVIMAQGDQGTTQLHIEEELSSSGTMFFMINSRNLSAPGAFSRINAGSVSLNGGRACICINPYLSFEIGDRWDLVEAESLLSGVYDTVEFDCVECPRRNAKSIQSEEAKCEPVASYGKRSFSVLFESCGGGSGNILERITPPWYVIFPVAIGIIICLIIVFGGALLIDEKVRQHKFKSKMRTKRSARVKKMAAAARSGTQTRTDYSSSQM